MMETKQNAIISRIKKLMRHAESAKQLGSLEEAEADCKKFSDHCRSFFNKEIVD